MSKKQPSARERKTLGQTVKVAWHMRDEATFVEVAGYAGPLRDGRADEWCYSQPVSVPSSAEVGRVVLAVSEQLAPDRDTSWGVEPRK